MARKGHPRSPRATLVLAVLLLGLLPAPGAVGDRFDPAPGELPWARGDAAAAWANGELLLAGGRGDPGDPDRPGYAGMTSEILRYRPEVGEVAHAKARLPDPRAEVAAAWNGTLLFLFGGLGCPDAACDEPVAQRDIVAYDPAADVATRLEVRLPAAVRGAAAVWTGQFVYVYGGFDARDRPVDRVLRFEPASGALVVLAERLPTPTGNLAAAWSGDRAYLFGGEGPLADVCRRSSCDPAPTQVVRHLPDRSALTVLDASLPRRASHPEVAAVGSTLYVFAPARAPHRPVVLFDVATERFRDPAESPAPRYAADGSVASDGRHVYVLAGRGRLDLDRFTPGAAGAPSAPRDLVVVPGPAPAQVLATWEPPHHGDGVAEYRVYRRAGFTEWAFLGASPATDRAYLDTMVRAGTTYEYAVSAVNAAGEGPRSASQAAEAPGAPCVPRGLQARSGPGTNQVSLSWEWPTCDGGVPIQAFSVYRTDQRGRAGRLLGHSEGLAFVDGAAPVGRLLFYRVAAVNEYGEGRATGYARSFAPRPPSEPTDLVAATGNDAVDLRWVAPRYTGGLPLTGFLVQRAIEGNPYQTVAETENATFRDIGCPLAKSCTYRVRAENAAGVGPASAPVRASGRGVGVGAEVRDDRTLYVYNDADRDGEADRGEGLFVTPRPPPLPVAPDVPEVGETVRP